MKRMVIIIMNTLFFSLYHSYLFFKPLLITLQKFFLYDKEYKKIFTIIIINKVYWTKSNMKKKLFIMKELFTIVQHALKNELFIMIY